MGVYREESGGNNERIGQYSYIGDDGKTYTVKYSAGVNGFRIIGGDHIPSGGQTSAQNQNVNAATGEIKEYDYEYMMTQSHHLLLLTPMILLITRRTFLMVILLVFSLAELSPPLPPFHSEWKPPPDQTDSSLLGRSSLTGSLKDLTSTSSPNKSPPTYSYHVRSMYFIYYVLS